MGNKGVTLVELLIVISIIGILAVLTGYSYVGWQGAYKVESTVKQMHSDLLTAKSNAMTRSRFYFANWTTFSYRVSEDANDNGSPDDAALPTYPKTIEYPIERNGWSTIIFDKRGIATAWTTIGSLRLIPPPPPPLMPPISADYDCIAIGQTRISMGKWGTICDVK